MKRGRRRNLTISTLAFRRISGLGAAQVERIKLKGMEIERRVLIPAGLWPLFSGVPPQPEKKSLC